MQLAGSNLESYHGIFLNLLFTDASFVRDENIGAIRANQEDPRSRSSRTFASGRRGTRGGEWGRGARQTRDCDLSLNVCGGASRHKYIEFIYYPLVPLSPPRSAAEDREMTTPLLPRRLPLANHMIIS